MTQTRLPGTGDLDRDPWFEDPESTPHRSSRGSRSRGRHGSRRSRRSRRSRGPRSWVRRHRALTALLVILVLLVGLVVAAALYLNRQIEAIPRIPVSPSETRPAAPANASMNILLAGADNGDRGDSIADTVRRGTWTPGVHRSDTIMVLHLTADRQHAYLISVPRDTYVPVPGHGRQKINAAFSLGGPSLFLQTLERFTDLRMQHLAIIDWNGFRDLSTALGGVRIYVPETVDDSHQGVFREGWQTLAGDDALAYVRTRYALPDGDLGRIQRQQNFMRAALGQAAQRGNLTNPLRFDSMLKAITGNLTVDDDFTNGEIRDLAWSLRGLRQTDITFITSPMARFESNEAGSVIIPDRARTAELFEAVRTDDLAAYVTKYGDQAGTLRPDTEVR